MIKWHLSTSLTLIGAGIRTLCRLILKRKVLFVYPLDPTTTDLIHVLNWVEPLQPDRILFVNRDYPDDNRIDQFVHATFAGNIAETFLATSWPGTALMGNGTAKVYVIAYNETTRQALIRTQPLLAGWLNSKQLPEDLCVYTSQAEYPYFFSCTHEGDFFLIDSRERKDGDILPLSRKYFLLPKARHFCIQA